MDVKNDLYKFFSDYVYKNTGIVYNENDYYRLDSRISSIIGHYGLSGEAELLKMCREAMTSERHELFVNLFTNNETFFMRDLKPFKSLASTLLPTVKSAFPGEKINMWSCACSTGQEVYSIYMAIESFKGACSTSDVSMSASDLSLAALDRAKEGKYTGLEVQRGLPAPFLVKYLSQEKTEGSDIIHWNINPELKRWPNFFRFNLIKDHFPANKYHIIFCRNVLIYQNVENKKIILEKIYNSLKPGGYLVLGAGESMVGIRLDYKQVEMDKAYFYQKV